MRLWIVLGSASVASTGCTSTPDATYRVRAEVVDLHGRGEDRRVTLAHETIPAFKDRDGHATGMHAMTMAFGIADRVNTRRFTPGSKWQVDFEVVWNRAPPLRITSAKPLPDDAPLELAR